MFTGCACAFLGGVLFSLILKKSFFSSPLAAATSIGFFAGLAGVAVLALHCPVQSVPHIVVWHMTVLGIGAAGGAIAGSLFGRPGEHFSSRP